MSLLDERQQIKRTPTDQPGSAGALRSSNGATGAVAPPWHAALLDSTVHDMRNTLAVIQCGVQLIAHYTAKADLPDHALIADRLADLNTAVLRLGAQIAQLGRWPDCTSARRAIDLVALAHQSAAAYQPLGEASRIRVESTDPQIWGVWDDVGMARIFDNLLCNAVKYSPAGGAIAIQITTEQHAGSAWATVRVCDHGIGIPKDALPNIFTPYYRAANVPPAIAGNGLGLASAYQLVAAEGGTITVRSRVNAGTCFTIRLPLRGTVAQPALEAV